MSLWDHKANVMDALVGLVISLVHSSATIPHGNEYIIWLKSLTFCAFVVFHHQAATSGKYLDSCLNMLISNFIPPPFVMRKFSQPRILVKKLDVLSRVHAALQKISYLVPLAPSRLVPILSQRMPKLHVKDPVSFSCVKNLDNATVMP